MPTQRAPWQSRSPIMAAVIAAILLSLGAGPSANAQAPVPEAIRKEALVTTRASGTFVVKLTPQATGESAGSAEQRERTKGENHERGKRRKLPGIRAELVAAEQHI